MQKYIIDVQNTKYMKIGISLVGEFDDDQLFDEQKQKLSDEVDKIMNEEIMKIKNKAKQQYDNTTRLL